MSASSSGNTKTIRKNAPLIYVVDDEPMLLELASVILEPNGYNIKTFRDPEVALQTFSSAKPRPDLIVTDYAMHTMNGMQLIERFRKLAPDVKILLVSGTVGEEIFLSAPTRPDQFLAKPYQAHALTEAVKSLLGGK
jgi:CheY-like chemotaxis protein